MKKNLIITVFGLCMLIFFTASEGAPWTQTNWTAGTSFFKIYTGQSNNVFARTWDTLNGGRIYLTTNNGTSWSGINLADSNTDILSIAQPSTNFIAGSFNGMYSSASGSSWSALTGTIPYTADSTIYSLTTINTTLYAGALGAVFSSTNNGSSWTSVSTGITAGARITSFVGSGTTIIAGSDTSGVFVSTNGTSWTASNTGLTDQHITQLAVIGTKVYAITFNGVFVSTIGSSLSWTADASGLNNVICYAVSGSQAFAGTDSSGIYRSSDNGATWNLVSSGIPNNARIWSLAANSSNIFAGTSTGIWTSPITNVVVGPSIPILAAPSNGATGQPSTLSLSWNSASLAQTYAAQVSTAADFSSTVFNNSGITTLSTSVSGLTWLKSYFWRVNATSSSAVTCSWSSVNSFTVQANPALPGTPVLASPTNGTTGLAQSVTLSWNSATVAKSYTAQLSTASDFSTTVLNRTGITGTLSTSISTLAYLTTYFWKVKAVNDSGSSLWSTVNSFSTMQDPTWPITPVLASPATGATGQSVTGITLSWNSASQATTYGLQVSTSAAFATTVTNTTGLSLSTVLNVPYYSTTYYWHVNSTNSHGTAAWATAWSFTTMAFAAPALSLPTNSATVRLPVTLSWGSVNSASSYNVQVSTYYNGYAGFTSTVYANSSAATSVVVSGLANGARYYWRVNAATSAGSISAWATVWTFNVATGVLEGNAPTLLADKVSFTRGAVSYTVSKKVPVEITLYNLRGEAVLNYNRMQSAGSYMLDLTGRHLSAGRYIIRFRAGLIEKRLVVQILGRRY